MRYMPSLQQALEQQISDVIGLLLPSSVITIALRYTTTTRSLNVLGSAINMIYF